MVSVCLFVSRITQKLYWTNFHKIRWKCGTWDTEETIRFWWESGSRYVRPTVRIWVGLQVGQTLYSAWPCHWLGRTYPYFSLGVCLTVRILPHLQPCGRYAIYWVSSYSSAGWRTTVNRRRGFRDLDVASQRIVWRRANGLTTPDDDDATVVFFWQRPYVRAQPDLVTDPSPHLAAFAVLLRLPCCACVASDMDKEWVLERHDVVQLPAATAMASLSVNVCGGGARAAGLYSELNW